MDRGRGGVVVSDEGGCCEVDCGATGVGVTMINLSVVVWGTLVVLVVMTGAAVVEGGLVITGNVVVAEAVVVTTTTGLFVVADGAVENGINV